MTRKMLMTDAEPVFHYEASQEDRHLVLAGEITSETMVQLAAFIGHFDHAEPGEEDAQGPDLWLTLNLEGGDVYAMFAMVDIIRSYPGKIHVKAVGMVWSAAILLVASCTGERKAGKHTVFMVHRIESRPEKILPTTLELEKDELMRLSNYWADAMTEVTKRPREFWEQLAIKTSKDYFISANDAVGFGIVDSLL